MTVPPTAAAAVVFASALDAAVAEPPLDERERDEPDTDGESDEPAAALAVPERSEAAEYTRSANSRGHRP